MHPKPTALQSAGLSADERRKHIPALEDLRGAIRIARAASVGVTGNQARIQRAVNAVANLDRMIEAAGDVGDRVWTFMGGEEQRAMQALRDALAAVRGGAK